MSPRSVFSPYARIFAAVPGSPAFSLAGWLARLPMPILGLGAVLLVEGETGSYGLAGAVAGTLALVGSLVSPQWARAMDRRGQGVVLRVAFTGYLVFGVAFVAAVVLGRAAVVVVRPRRADRRAADPNIGSIVRARWADALDAERRQTAFAFESVVDEVVFVVGPPLVTFLATLINPPVGFLTGVVIGFGGGDVAVPAAGHRAAGAARPTRTAPRRASALLQRHGAARRASSTSPSGAVFGAMDVVVVAYAEAEGAPAMAGVALAVYAGGSLVAGLVYGVVRLPGGLAARYVGCAVFFAVAAQLLFAVDSLVSLVAVGFLAGLAIAPVLVSGMSLVESRVPRVGAHRGADLGGHRAHAGGDGGLRAGGRGRGRLGCRDRIRRPGAVRRAGRRPGAGRRAAAAWPARSAAGSPAAGTPSESRPRADEQIAAPRPGRTHDGGRMTR